MVWATECEYDRGSVKTTGGVAGERDCRSRGWRWSCTDDLVPDGRRMRSLIGWLRPSHPHHHFRLWWSHSTQIAWRLWRDLEETTVPGPLLKNGASPVCLPFKS